MNRNQSHEGGFVHGEVLVEEERGLKLEKNIVICKA
jgi:hypothetical protein